MDFVSQLIAQLGITVVGGILLGWTVTKFLGKSWVEHQFKRWEEEHSQGLQHEYKQKQEAFRQALDHEYKEKQESFKQALASEYNQKLEAYKAQEQRQIEIGKGLVAERLEGTKAGHQQNLEKTKSELEENKQMVGAALAVSMEHFKAGLDFKSKTRLSNSERRLESYRSLWSLMAPLSPQTVTTLDRANLDAALRKWYYDAGNGIFLTWGAQHTYLLATKLLNEKVDAVTDAEVRDAFSLLRTQMKLDVAIYSDEESEAQAG